MHQLLRLVYFPRKIFWIGVIFSTLSLIFNGSLLRLYGLYREEERLTLGIQENHNKIKELTASIQKAKDPVFIEREARNRYDLVDKNDIVFVFADE